MSGKIIVAADDLNAIRTIEAALAEQGYELIVALRGPESTQSGSVEYTRFVGKSSSDAESHDLETRLTTTEHLLNIGHFAAGTVSEINYELMHVLGYIELVMEGLEPESEAHWNLQKAADAAARIADQTRRLHLYTRSTLKLPDLPSFTGSAASFEEKQESTSDSLPENGD